MKRRMEASGDFSSWVTADRKLACWRISSISRRTERKMRAVPATRMQRNVAPSAANMRMLARR